MLPTFNPKLCQDSIGESGPNTKHGRSVPTKYEPGHMSYDDLVAQLVTGLLEHSQNKLEECEIAQHGGTVRTVDVSIKFGA